MICAACFQEGHGSPCEGCGHDPKLLQRYTLVEVIARGGTGEVYRAHDAASDRQIAIKHTSVHRQADPKRHELLHREARVLEQLDHPNIPRYLAHHVREEHDSTHLYLMQELVEGTPLTVGGARRDQDEVFHIARVLLETLAYLHARTPPVLHRDVRPGNVVERHDNQYTLLDFGSVRDTVQDPDLGGETVIGTFGYMAPEQFAGDASPASDVYGVGALTVALLARRPAHRMLSPQGRLDWRRHAVLPVPLAQWLDRMLDPDPSMRVPSATDALHLLDAALEATQRPVEVAEELPSAAPQAQRRVATKGREDNAFDIDDIEHAPPARLDEVHHATTALAHHTGRGLLTKLRRPLLWIGIFACLSGAIFTMGPSWQTVPPDHAPVTDVVPTQPEDIPTRPESERDDRLVEEYLQRMLHARNDSEREAIARTLSATGQPLTAADIATVFDACQSGPSIKNVSKQLLPRLRSLTSAEALTLAEASRYDDTRASVLAAVYTKVTDPQHFIRTTDACDASPCVRNISKIMAP